MGSKQSQNLKIHSTNIDKGHGVDLEIKFASYVYSSEFLQPVVCQNDGVLLHKFSEIYGVRLHKFIDLA